MEGFAVLLVLCFVITSLMLSCRWYFIRYHAYNEWVAEQQRIQRRAAEQNGFVIFTVEGEVSTRSVHPVNGQEEINKRDELPCYEDALKLPKPGEVPSQSINQSSITV